MEKHNLIYFWAVDNAVYFIRPDNENKTKKKFYN